MRSLSIAVAGLLAGNLHAQSPTCRFANPIWPVGTAPTDVAAADFDGDGRPDLATIGSGGFVHVARQTGGLQFAPAAALAQGNSATRIQAVEATGDGILDLVISQNSVRVFAGDGVGNFTALPTLFTASFSGAPRQRNDVSVANFNGDAWPDIAATDEGARAVHVFLGIGGGAFAAPQVLSTQPGPHNPNDIAVADFNGDGNLDLATCDSYNTHFANLAIYLGSASGTFAAPMFHSATYAQELAAGDFTGDGIADLAMLAANSGGSGYLEFYGGNGTGAFTQIALVPIVVTGVLWPIDLFARDLDGDGDLDALVIEEEGGVHAVQSLGGGAFTLAPKMRVGGALGGLDLSDFESDGTVDFACTLRSGGVVLASGDGQGGFEMPSLVDIGSVLPNGATLHAMDFDNDARTDLLFHTIPGGLMGVARGNASGGFHPAVFTSVVGASSSSGFQVGSFGPDLYPDLVLRATNQRLRLWLGNGVGGFVPANEFAAQSEQACAVGDLNGDGNADVLVEAQYIGPPGALSSPGFRIYYGDGLGQFPTNQSFSYSHTSARATIADLDANGLEDILIVAGGDKFVLMSQLTPSTFSQVWTANTGGSARFLQLADLDGNGYMDIVASLSDPRIAIGLGQPGGTFGAISHVALGSAPAAISTLVAIADFDADGFVDLAPGCGDGAMRLFPGDGAGGFGSPTLFAFSGATVALDYDGDGDHDIVAGNYELELRENLGASCRPIAYCTGKVNSLGCAPAMDWTGTPSATATSGFLVRAANIRNKKSGLLMYGVSGRATIPFSGGTLCVNSQVKRSTAVHSGGSPSGNDCTGVYAIDMNSFAAGLLGGTPLAALQVVGTAVDCQFWGRDPGFTPPNATALSDALEYLVGM